jgi:hypothetical protein
MVRFETIFPFLADRPNTKVMPRLSPVMPLSNLNTLTLS